MGIKKLLRNSLSALVIGATSISSMPSVANAKPLQEISVSESKDDGIRSALIENSRYVLDPSVTMADSASFEFENLKDGYVGIGGVNQIMNLLFALPGKLRRPAFMGNRHFGKRVPNYLELDWHKFTTAHTVVGAYDGELHLLDDFVKVNEANFRELEGRFGFSEFRNMPTAVFYRNGTEFLQDKMFWPGRGTAGVTKVLGKNEMAAYFNGHRGEFAHTTKHEFVHWFDLQRMKGLDEDTVESMRLWMIEGLAEYYSVGWRAVHEQIMRDLWSNGVFIGMDDLDYYRGSFLTYTFGNFYTKFLEETFGPGTALKLRDNAMVGKLEDILKKVTDHSMDDLNRMAKEYAQRQFADMDGKVDGRKVLADGFLLASDDDRFLTWKFDEGHIKMYVNKFKKNELVSKEVARDAEYGSESLISLFFGDGVDMRQDKVVFSVNDSGRDKLVVREFAEDEKSFRFGGKEEKSFDGITEIFSPRVVDDNAVLFVGSADGYHDLYNYDFSTGKLSRMTSSKRGIGGLDVHGSLAVFSREGDRTSNPNGCEYYYDLYLMDLKTGEAGRIMSEPGRDTRPRFSPDGRYVAFQREVGFVNNVFVHDFKTGVDVRLDREIVGAESPQFLGDDKLLLNTTRLLKPQVRVRELGSLEALVRDALESKTADDVGAYRIRKNELLLKDVLSGDDGKMKINLETGKYVEEIIFNDGRFYILGEDDFYEVADGKVKRRNPMPVDFRREQFSGMIRDDITFLEKNSSIYYFGVNDDWTRAVILLNDKFFNKAAFEKVGMKPEKVKVPAPMSKYPMTPTPINLAPEKDKVPILIYNSGSQSLFKPDNRPLVSYSDAYPLANKEKLDAEFLANGDIFLRGKSGLVSLFSDRSSFGALEKLRDAEDVDGEIKDVAVSKDKRFVAFEYYDHEKFGFDDHAIVVYSGKDSNPWDVVINTERREIGNMRFLDDNSLFFTTESKKLVHFYSYDPLTSEVRESVYRKKDDDKLSGVVSAGGKVLFSVANEDEVQRLYSVSLGGGEPKMLSERKEYSKLRTIDDLILYEEKDVYGVSETKALGKEPVIIRPDKYKQLSPGDWSVAHVIINDGGLLYDVDFGGSSVKKLADESFGFDLKGNELVFSKAENGVFNIYSYNVGTGEQKALTKNFFNSFRPLFVGDAVYYEADVNGENHVRKIKDGVDEPVPLSAPAARLELIHGELQGRVLPKGKPAPSGVADYSYSEGVIEKGQFSPWPVHDIHGGFVIAFNGRSTMGMVDIIALNELNTNAALVSIYSSPDFKMYSMGFVDFARDFGVNSQYLSFGDNQDLGLEVVKSMPVNAYLSFDGFLGAGYQDYPGYEFGTRNNFYPTVGASVSYDDTTFDYLRGPREGTRGFLRLETGYSITGDKVNNYDVNLDIRNYAPLIGRSGFEQRFMAGTSQGDNNHIFVLGGNISMRGVPFDSLWGQNYAVGNLDFRMPIFEAVGAAIAGTDYLNPGFSAFDVRAGVYLDGAAVGFNGEKSLFLYSSGIDVNAICFGSLILRYNKGFFGEKDWNFWIGYNP